MSKNVIKLSEVKPVEFVTTGVAEIDTLVGGYPRGRLTQVFGLASVGKTALMTHCLAALSQRQASVLYFDVENAINTSRVLEMGAEASKIAYSNMSQLEAVCEEIRQSLGKYDVIIVDSIAMLVPRAEQQGETGEAHVGLKPRLLGQFMREVTEALGTSKTALVFVNQLRRTMTLYGDPYVLPGGMQLTYSSSLMLRLTSTTKDRINKGTERIGHWVNVEVTKNKLGRPYTTTRFKLTY